MINHVVVPLDGSETAEQAVDTARDLAKSTGCRLSLLNVIHHVGPLHPTTERLMRPELERASTYLRSIEKRLQGGGIKAKGFVKIGEPADVIADFAANEAIDLIALSIRGAGHRSGSIGSIAVNPNPPKDGVRTAEGGG